ncbi:nucleoside triphosphate pyrophosphatase [Paracoccus sp. S1E-3]|uniref:Maf family protein n=1 Tax=Paracoccus sp. S1E-3 TaxID=2756130 RepID=UPI0015EF0666|nr:nucleoside triphosphate pyrophosphatase [Paracoccus sp. S1E-3]MBA4492057.1 septum formation inhibitor Maf [Paracoccus sp. S1E-3]
MTRTHQARLILGSASPRRLDLLAQIGITPDEIRPADIDETPRRNEDARAYVRRMAAEKAEAVSAAPDDIVLAADTVVTAGRRILGKPEDAAEARAFLTLLSGRRHRVMTAITLRRGGREWSRLVETQVRLRPLSAREIEDYLASGEWQGKAGGYAIQGRAGAFVNWIEGSFSAVVGLPLAETATLLRAAQAARPSKED